MIERDLILKSTKNFKVKYGIERADESLIASIHCMNQHGIDYNAALDQSSEGPNEIGFDAWHYEKQEKTLYFYKSKFTENKSEVLKGLNELLKAANWFHNVLSSQETTKEIEKNTYLYNLYKNITEFFKKCKRIELILLSSFDSEEIEDSSEYELAISNLVKSGLNKYFSKKHTGRIALSVSSYNLKPSIAVENKKYAVDTLTESTLKLRDNARLELSYIPLYSLVELYRQRGDILFDKNIRLALIESRDTKDRLVHPLFETLDQITSGKLSPSIFPFYHVGITIASNHIESESEIMSMEKPNIINGCQTISIANEYLKKLEKTKDLDKMDLFKQIKVIAKVVVGTTDDELKEITNSNNRQNPIQNWQLFSNEPVHIEIENILKDHGVFYERQKGKFNTIARNYVALAEYPNTNHTFIKVEELGQIISLSKRELNFAARASEIFMNKANHSKIFIKSIPTYAKDMIIVFNLFKGLKRGLINYLNQPAFTADSTQKIFLKPIVKVNMWYAGLLYYYQLKSEVLWDYSTKLNKIAPQKIVEDSQLFFPKIIDKTKKWYLEESNDFKLEVSQKRLGLFVDSLMTEIGIDIKGQIPFSSTAHKWEK